MTTTRKPCNCASTFQDRRCGRGVRVHNVGNAHITCTCCGKVTSISRDAAHKMHSK